MTLRSGGTQGCSNLLSPFSTIALPETLQREDFTGERQNLRKKEDRYLLTNFQKIEM